MVIALYLCCAVLLLALNGFFVLAEFAAVKVRPSRVDTLVAQGNKRARLVKTIQTHLDEYLSVCQVGITFASIGLGFVAEPAIVRLIEPGLAWTGWLPTDPAHAWLTAHGIAFAISYLLVSFLHILVGELVPKSVAIRAAEASALWTAPLLRGFHFLFFVPLWILNGSANAVMRVIGLQRASEHEQHSEDELRIILSHSHTTGVMSFRRLLFMENVFDFGELKVRDAMRVRANVKTLSLAAPWPENLAVMRAAKYSRYPLLDAGGKALGVVHVKDLALRDEAGAPDLVRLARGFVGATEDASLEQLLAEMQRRRIHVALVTGKDGAWTGFISMEDIIEEIIGTVDDEFAAEPPVFLGDVITPGRVLLELEAESIELAIGSAFRSVKPDELPLEPAVLSAAVSDRERLVSTYLGYGIAMPHARLPGLARPFLMFARSPGGIPLPGRDEKIHLLFILLTPAGQPRIHQRLQARIAGILDSDFVDSRLREATSVTEIIEAIRTGEQTALD
jgi:CBS domain containing-hemolysin-like protein